MSCPICQDDGWVEVWDDECMAIVATHECPRLGSAGHAPFNATGLLPTGDELAAGLSREHPS